MKHHLPSYQHRHYTCRWLYNLWVLFSSTSLCHSCLSSATCFQFLTFCFIPFAISSNLLALGRPWFLPPSSLSKASFFLPGLNNSFYGQVPSTSHLAVYPLFSPRWIVLKTFVHHENYTFGSYVPIFVLHGIATETFALNPVEFISTVIFPSNRM